MCGFVGIVGRDFKPVTPSNNEILSQSHRGPDQSTFLRIKNALFIHSRLAIQDLSDNARQPMEHWTEQIVICWAGEIYNFRELIKEFNLEIPLNKRNSDTAVLLELYHSIGIKMLSHLNGIFAIAIYNLRDNTVILARDHFGVKPLYFYFQNETLYFATEIKSILMYLSEYKANHEVVLHYLQSGQITLGTKTMFEGINLVEPGELINFNAENSKICRKKFFDIEEEIANLDDKPNSEEIIYELEASVKRNLHGDVPVALSLSSGLDSSILLQILNTLGVKNTSMFGFGFQSVKYDESIVAEKNATKNGYKYFRTLLCEDSALSNLEKAIPYFEGPLGGIGTLGLYMLSQRVKQEGFKVLLSGEGADELFGGYDYYYSAFLNDKKNWYSRSSNIKSFANARNMNYSDARKFLLTTQEINIKSKAPDGTSTFISADYNLEWIVSINDWIYKMRHEYKFSESQIIRLLDLKIRKIPKLLHFLDRAGASNGVEARVPFLSPKLAIMSLSLPEKFHFKDGFGKSLLRKYSRNKGSNPDAFKIKKTVATPQREWFQGEFGKEAKEIILNGRFIKSIYTNEEWLKSELNNYMSNPNLPANSFFIWQALNMELTLKAYPKLF